MNQDNKNLRYHLVDMVRGVAIILMIIFHFTYDINKFGYTNINFQTHWFWFNLPRVIVTLFMWSAGISLCLAHRGGINWSKYFKRLGKIVFFAIIITISTYIYFPKNWVYFGTLHSIATCSILALPFLSKKWTSLIVGLVVIVFHNFIYKIPWFILPHQSMDYIPPSPWLGAMLLGIYSYHAGHYKFSIKQIDLLTKLGQHSLLIYILHQPILFGCVWIYYKFSS